jgi:hypothetical protein
MKTANAISLQWSVAFISYPSWILDKHNLRRLWITLWTVILHTPNSKLQLSDGFFGAPYIWPSLCSTVSLNVHGLPADSASQHSPFFLSWVNHQITDLWPVACVPYRIKNYFEGSQLTWTQHTTAGTEFSTERMPSHWLNDWGQTHNVNTTAQYMVSIMTATLVLHKTGEDKIWSYYIFHTNIMITTRIYGYII